MSRRSPSVRTSDEISFPTQLECIGFFVFGFVIVSLCSGVVLGWPSLRRQLVIKEESTLTEQTLGSIFTVGAWSTQAGRFFYGVTRDRWLGTKWTTSVAVVLCLAGALGTAFCSPNNGTALAISLFFMGMGSGTQLCLQPVAGLFDPNMQGAVLQTFSGAFQISGLVFVILTSVTSNRKRSFLSYAGLVFLFLIGAVIILPKGNFANRKNFFAQQEASADPEEQTDSGSNKPLQEEELISDEEEISPDKTVGLDNSDDATNPDPEAEESSSTVSISVSNAEKEKVPLLLDQLKSAEYIMLVLWFAALLIPLNYYVGSIGFQLEELGDDDGKYTRILTILYASSAIISPLSGKLSDVAGLGVTQNIANLFVAASLFLIAATNVPLSGHVPGMACYGVGRMMIFGSFFANVGKRFGYTHYGTLSGLGLLISGVVSLLQYPLIVVATEGNSGAVNIGCGIFVLAWMPYGFWLSRREWKK